MKRSIKMLIIAVIVLALMIGGYFLAINWQPEKEKAEAPQQEKTEVNYIINEELEDIDCVEFHTQTAHYTIRNGEKPSIEGYSSYVIDNAKLQAAMFGASSVIAGHTVSENPENLDSYGLESEENYVSVKLKDGSERKLIIGNSANFEGEYYVKLADEETVYTVEDYTANNLLAHPDEYRSLNVCSIDGTTIADFEVSQKGVKVLSVKYDEKEKSQSELHPYVYKIEYPYPGAVANLDALTIVYESVSSVSASKIVEENPKNLSKYGLDKPYVFTVKDQYGTVTLKMGNYAENGEVYVMRDDLPVVYSAYCSFYETIKNLKADDYVDRFIHLMYLDTVEGVTVKTPDVTHNMTITRKSEDKTDYNIDGRIKVKETFTKIYTNVIGLSASEFTSASPSGTEKCAITFNFTDKTSKTFTYYNYNERYCIVKSNNGISCLVLNESVDEMLDSFN